MAHPHDQFDRAVLAGHVEHFVQQRQQRSIAFERKALVAEIALLQRLLEQIGLDQQIEGQFLFDMFGFALEPFLDPSPPFRIGDVHELRAHASAVNAARFLRPLVFNLKVGMRLAEAAVRAGSDSASRYPHWRNRSKVRSRSRFSTIASGRAALSLVFRVEVAIKKSSIG